MLAKPFSRRRLAVKSVDVWRKDHQDRRDRAQSLHALDHVAAAEFAERIFGKTET